MKFKIDKDKMKKIGIISGIILVVIIVAIITIVIVRNVQMSGRQYTISKINLSDYQYFITNENGKVGVIDKTGKEIIEPMYDDITIPNPTKDVFICMYNYNVYKKTYDLKIVNSSNQELFTEYQKVEPILINGISSSLPYDKTVLKYEYNDKYGLIDLDGNVVTEPIYDELDSLKYKEGEFIVKENDKYGVINNVGHVMVKCQYDSIEGDKYYTKKNEYKNSGYIVGLKKDDAVNFLYGYVNYLGKEIVDVQYQKILRFVDVEDDNNAYLSIGINEKYQLFKNGKAMVDIEFDDIKYNKDSNVFSIVNNEEIGLINPSGNLVVPVHKCKIELRKCVVKVVDEEISYYDLNGNEIYSKNNDELVGTENSKYAISIGTNNKYGIVTNGNTSVENKYVYIEYLYDNYFIAKDENMKLGIINDKDDILVEFQYDTIGKINDTKALIAKKLDAQVYDIYTNKLEKVASSGRINISKVEKNDKASIEIYMSGKTIYMNDDGEKIDVQVVYPKNVLFSKENNGKYGFIDKSGNMVVDSIYDEVTEFNEFGYAGVKTNGKWGVINSNGEVIVQPIYEFANGQRPDFIGEYVKGYYGYGQIYYTK